MAGLTAGLLAAVVRLAPLDLQAGAAFSHAAAAPADPHMWYLTRALATSAYLTLTVSVLLGMLRSLARQSRERLSWIIDELHQVFSTLALVLVLGHLLTLLVDPFLPFTLSNLLLPLAEPYKPLPVRFGVLALYGMVLLLLSSWIRRWIPYGIWRSIHYLSFLLFVLATAHGLLAGSDTSEPWARAVYTGAAASVLFMSLMRMFGGNPASSQAVKQD
jgi:sulfoxide reductase heme-binding subunit YedZ